MLIISIYLQILCGTIIYVLEYHYQKDYFVKMVFIVKYSLGNMLHFIKWYSIHNPIHCHLYHKTFSNSLFSV